MLFIKHYISQRVQNFISKVLPSVTVCTTYHLIKRESVTFLSLRLSINPEREQRLLICTKETTLLIRDKFSFLINSIKNNDPRVLNCLFQSSKYRNPLSNKSPLITMLSMILQLSFAISLIQLKPSTWKI